MVHAIRGLTLALALGSSSLAAAQGGPDMLELFHPGADVRWVIVNDGVMGGVSRSEVVRTQDGNVLFVGTLSLENNGGFASTRVLLGERDLSSFDALELELRGDGRSYQLRVREGDGFDGVAFRAEFATSADEWQTFRIRFDDLLPTFRGRVLSNVDPLDLARIGQIGLLLADGNPGRFALEIRSIRAISDLQKN